jgi:RNA polymerase sigma factor (sigma-70 family)
MVVNEYRMTTEEFKQQMVPYARKLYPMMKRLLGNEEEVRDALQELMIKLWNKKEFLEDCQNRDGYVLTVARNFCFDLRKKRKVRTIEYLDESRISVPVPEYDQDTHEKLEHMHRIVENLPDKYREILQLREMDGFSFGEIHELTGLEMTYIRVLLSRSRIRVKEEMEKIYNYERGTYQTAG